MKYIANILTNKPFLDKELYNIVSDRDSLVDNIPTLIIGWEFTKSMYPNANILDWKIDDNTYWTFGMRERRSEHDKDIVKFREMAMNRVIKSIKYDFFNILTSKDDEKVEVFNKINSNDIVAYIENNMVYLYSDNFDSVIGISLNDIDYLGKDRNNFLSQLYQRENVEIISNKDAFSNETKISLRNYNYIIPYLCS